MQKTKIKKIFINILLLIGIIILFIVFSEIVLRIFNIGGVAPKNSGNLLQFIKEVDNPELGFELIPDKKGYLRGVKVEINPEGLRDHYYSLKKPKNTFRICVIGDSVAFGFGVEANESFPKILEEKLNEKTRAEVINFAVPAYNGVQEFTILKDKVLDYDPDLIIIAHFLNDPDGVWNLFETSAPISPTIKTFFSENSYLYNFVRGRWGRVLNRAGVTSFTPYKNLYEEDSEIWKTHKERFENMSAISKSEKIPILVVILPNWKNLNESYDFKEEHKLISNTVDEAGLDFLDIYPKIYGLDEVDYLIDPEDAAHPNYKGHELLGYLIYMKIVKEGYVNIKD